MITLDSVDAEVRTEVEKEICQVSCSLLEDKRGIIHFIHSRARSVPPVQFGHEKVGREGEGEAPGQCRWGRNRPSLDRGQCRWQKTERGDAVTYRGNGSSIMRPIPILQRESILFHMIGSVVPTGPLRTRFQVQFPKSFTASVVPGARVGGNERAVSERRQKFSLHLSFLLSFLPPSLPSFLPSLLPKLGDVDILLPSFFLLHFLS